MSAPVPAAPPAPRAPRTGNFFAEIDGLAVHVNRRGCEGDWTEKDDEALTELVRAAREQFGRKP